MAGWAGVFDWTWSHCVHTLLVWICDHLDGATVPDWFVLVLGRHDHIFHRCGVMHRGVLFSGSEHEYD